MAQVDLWVELDPVCRVTMPAADPQPMQQPLPAGAGEHDRQGLSHGQDSFR